MKKPRVLLMDDELDIQEVVSELLTIQGYEVVCVRDGREALTSYLEAMQSGQPFSAVVLDLTVDNGMGGEETIRKLLEVDPEVRAVVSSGFANEPAMINFRQHGFQARVAKPYRVEELDQALRSLF
ncbi:MAG: response regulator [Candidatus Delongbacteria bacterium]|nr:response regulator [Candidatus Delongbacteria bacterium]